MIQTQIKPNFEFTEGRKYTLRDVEVSQDIPKRDVEATYLETNFLNNICSASRLVHNFGVRESKNSYLNFMMLDQGIDKIDGDNIFAKKGITYLIVRVSPRPAETKEMKDRRLRNLGLLVRGER